MRKSGSVGKRYGAGRARFSRVEFGWVQRASVSAMGQAVAAGGYPAMLPARFAKSSPLPAPEARRASRDYSPADFEGGTHPTAHFWARNDSDKIMNSALVLTLADCRGGARKDTAKLYQPHRCHRLREIRYERCNNGNRSRCGFAVLGYLNVRLSSIRTAQSRRRAERATEERKAAAHKKTLEDAQHRIES
mgnify:CR=1 FL=1